MYRLMATNWVALEALINGGTGWACIHCGLMGAWFNRVQSEGAGAAHSGWEADLSLGQSRVHEGRVRAGRLPAGPVYVRSSDLSVNVTV